MIGAAALEGRLLDIDDKVRIQAVTAVCDLARVDLKLIPSRLIICTAERLRDKKVYCSDSNKEVLKNNEGPMWLDAMIFPSLM